MYRARPPSYRNYYHIPKDFEPLGSPASAPNTINEIKGIPLPTDDEVFKNTESGSSRIKNLFSFDAIRKYIGIEEIILLGLIFLLIEEGLKDDFLLIILIVVLATGFEFRES